jgi:hypothetical protein
MINLTKLFCTIIFLSLLSLTNIYAQDKLIGIWESKDGEFTGAQIEVFQNGISFEGKFIMITQSMKGGCFIEGEVKWMNIFKDEKGHYSMIDFSRNKVDCNEGSNYKYVYFTDSTSIIVTSSAIDTDKSPGSQVWVKVSSE